MPRLLKANELQSEPIQLVIFEKKIKKKFCSGKIPKPLSMLKITLFILMHILKISGGVWLVQVHDFDDNADLDLIRKFNKLCLCIV